VSLAAQIFYRKSLRAIEAVAGEYMTEQEGSKPRRIKSVRDKLLLISIDVEHKLHNRGSILVIKSFPSRAPGKLFNRYQSEYHQLDQHHKMDEISRIF